MAYKKSNKRSSGTGRRKPARRNSSVRKSPAKRAGGTQTLRIQIEGLPQSAAAASHTTMTPIKRSRF